MKKKIVSACVVVALAAVAVAGGTLAYFTDDDSDVNVMTTGKVSIVQNEVERDANNNLVPYEGDKTLYPATGDNDGNGWIDNYGGNLVDKEFPTNACDDEGNPIVASIVSSDNNVSLFPKANNAIDKIVTVTNDGESDAYVRTLFAFEVPTDGNEGWIDIVNVQLMTVVDGGLTPGVGIVWTKDAEGNYITIEINGVTYLVGEYYYQNNSMLMPGQTSNPSLVQVYMTSDVDNEFAETMVGSDGLYNIIVVSQAAQVAGFGSAEQALDTAFGDLASINSGADNELTIEELTSWFENALPQA